MTNLILPVIEGKHDAMQLFRDYFNNFLTVRCFAEHYGLTMKEAHEIIREGRELHNLQAEILTAQ